MSCPLQEWQLCLISAPGGLGSCRTLGLFTFLSATLVLHISIHFPPPAGKNVLLFTAWETGTFQDRNKRQSLQPPLTSLIFEQLLPLWASRRVTKTLCK